MGCPLHRQTQHIGCEPLPTVGPAILLGGPPRLSSFFVSSRNRWAVDVLPVASVVTRPRGRAREALQERVAYTMNDLEQLTRDVRGFATEVRTLGYSSVASGHENQFLELSERMTRHADQVDRRSH